MMSAPDIRAEIARRGVPRYVLAAYARLHPVKLGRLLNGRVTLTPVLAERIMRALDQVGK
jgi:plasmid maintenance system antidote protein VapI